MKLSVITRYFLKEVGLAWLAVSAVLVAVLMTSRLVRFLADAASGDLPAGAIFHLLGLKTLSYMGVVLPASFFLGTVLAFGRLYRDSEMAAMFACGVGPRQLYRALFGLSIPLSVLVALSSLWLSPWSARAAAQVQAEATQDLELQGLRPGRFVTSKRVEGMFYLESLSHNRTRMRNVFLQAPSKQGVVLVSAASARQEVDPATGDRFLVLENGYRYEGQPEGGAWKIVQFREHGVRVADQPLALPRIRRDGLPTEALWLTREQFNDSWAELQRRISMPLMTLVLTLLAVPLSRSDPRDGRYGKVLTAVLAFVIYSNLLTVSEEGIKDGRISVWVGVWWVHLIAAVVALGWLSKGFGTTWYFRKPVFREAV